MTALRKIGVSAGMGLAWAAGGLGVLLVVWACLSPSPVGSGQLAGGQRSENVNTQTTVTGGSVDQSKRGGEGSTSGPGAGAPRVLDDRGGH